MQLKNLYVFPSGKLIVKGTSFGLTRIKYFEDFMIFESNLFPHPSQNISNVENTVSYLSH